MITDWKKAALVKAAAKVAVEKEAEEKAAAQRAAEEATKKDPLIGRSQGKASLWDSKRSEYHKLGPVSTRHRMVANSILNCCK